MSLAERTKAMLFRSPGATTLLRKLRVVLHWLHRAPHEIEFELLRHPRFLGALMLDLGANIGQSALSARAAQPTMRVIAIEANPACEPSLRMTKWLLRSGFDYHLVAVGSSPGILGFFVPVRSSRMLLEEGTFFAESLDGEASRKRNGVRGRDFTVQELKVSVVTVDSLGLTPDVVKMDLQGFELEALRGMSETIRRAAPIMIVEQGRTHADVRTLLTQMGYTEHSWRSGRLTRGVTESDLNAIFLPPNDPLDAVSL